MISASLALTIVLTTGTVGYIAFIIFDRWCEHKERMKEWNE